MVEPELAFSDLQDDMDCAEAYLKHCISHVLEHCDEDLEFFEKNVSKDNLRERLRGVATTPFARITYTEAVEHVLSAKKKDSNSPWSGAATCSPSTSGTSARRCSRTSR